MAVLFVVAFHSGLSIPGGFVGVDVFFVISGFVITNMLDREWRQTGRIRLGNFYLRRFKRLTPALAVMVAITALASAVIVSPFGPQKTVAETTVGAMLIVANFVIARVTGGYFGEDAHANPLLHTWSLSVEEQFYLLLPAIIVIGWIVARRRYLTATPFILLAVFALSSFALAVAGSAGFNAKGLTTLVGFYSPLTRTWEFLAGALLALSLAGTKREFPRWLSASGVAGATLLAVSIIAIDGNTPFPGAWTLVPVFGTLLLLAAGTGGNGLTFRALSSGPMVKVGDWSYSIYLWHWPFIVFAGMIWARSEVALVLAAVASVIPAALSFKYIERPIRDMTIGSLRGKATLVTTTLMVPILIGSALYVGVSYAWWSDPVRRVQIATGEHPIAHTNGCDERVPLGLIDPNRCIWNKDLKTKPIYLLGDSQSAQFGEGFIQAADNLGRPLYIASANACPFVDLHFKISVLGRDNESCETYVRTTLQDLNGMAPGLVVIANADSYWVDHEVAVGVSQESKSIEVGQKIAALRVGLGRTIEELRAAGHQVVLIQTVPHWYTGNIGDGDSTSKSTYEKIWDPTACTNIVAIRDKCSAQRSLESAIAERSNVRSAVNEVAQISGAIVWDPVVQLCPSAICSTEAPLYTRYRDKGHISSRQSLELAADIERLLGVIDSR